MKLLNIYIFSDHMFVSATHPTTSDRDSEFSLSKKRANKLEYTYENFVLDILYSKPRCHVVSKAFRYPNIPQPDTCYC
jgi:hypothetical protein